MQRLVSDKVDAHAGQLVRVALNLRGSDARGDETSFEELFTADDVLAECGKTFEDSEQAVTWQLVCNYLDLLCADPVVTMAASLNGKYVLKLGELSSAIKQLVLEAVVRGNRTGDPTRGTRVVLAPRFPPHHRRRRRPHRLHRLRRRLHHHRLHRLRHLAHRLRHRLALAAYRLPRAACRVPRAACRVPFAAGCFVGRSPANTAAALSRHRGVPCGQRKLARPVAAFIGSSFASTLTAAARRAASRSSS